MKLYLSLPLSSLAILAGLFCYPFISLADVSPSISIGITQTDNLEVQQDSNVSLNNGGSVKRSGLDLGISILKDNIDYTGGYSIQASANYNKALDKTGDISHLKLSASKLTALNTHWLMRSNVQVQRYRNQPIALNSYDGINLENTIGYLGDKNGGVDISLQYANENHNQADIDSYKIRRSIASFAFYFPHTSNAPYVALNTRYGKHNSNNDQRDYNGLNFGVEYRQWSIGKYSGIASIQWQQDKYAINSRKDHYSLVQLSLARNLKKNLDLQITAGTGRYQSSLLDSPLNFYQIASYLNWGF